MVPKGAKDKNTYGKIIKGLKSGSYISFGYDKKVCTISRWISSRGVW